MASWLQSTSSGLRLLCSRHTAARYYSDARPLASATAKWGLAGVPRPRSILEDDDAEIDLSEDNEVVNGASPNTPPAHLRKPSGKPTPLEYKAHRETLRKEFPEGWAPPRKLSREAMDALRQLNRHDPEKFRTPVLAEKFKISPEAVRRILKSKWEPSLDKRSLMAIKEREQRDEVKLERRKKELSEATGLRELRKSLRNPSDGGGEHEPEEQRERGLNPSDRFTFR